MARISVFIVHDETGRIISIARPAESRKVVVGSGAGEAVFETEVEEESIPHLVTGTRRVDIARKALLPYDEPSST
jgi:hypothetical protein